MQPASNTLLLLPIREQDHVHGSASAPLTLVEYGDYQCPACGQLFVILREVQEALGDRLRIVYRHYPLSGLHPNAQEAAEAAEAAGVQGRFWEMHDLLFQNQGSLKRKDLLAYAESLGLDMRRFRSELTGSMYRDRVREDFRYGVQNGVYGTPGLFLNGVRHDDAWDRTTLLQKLTTAT